MSASYILGVLTSGRRGVCPECGGGRSKEACLKVWQYEGKIHAKCYRNSCGKRWVLSARGVDITQVDKSEQVWQYLVEPTLEKTREIWTRLSGLDGSPKPVRMDGKEGLCYPIRSCSGVLKGHSVRFYEGRLKSVVKYLDGVPRKELAWFLNTTQAPTKPLLIVEDCYSAVLASRYLPTVCLLGTELTSDMFSDILLNQGRGFSNRVLFALDRDAYTKSLFLARLYSSFIQTDVIELDKDIKDLSDTQIEQLLGPLAAGDGA